MSVPDQVRVQLREQLWKIADEIDWLALNSVEKSQHYQNWTKDTKVGGILQRYMSVGQVRMYLKDTLLKDYPRSRRADHSMPYRLLGLIDETEKQTFIKPHGFALDDGRVVCWGRAADWKSVLTAVFERSYLCSGATPHAAILTEAFGKYADAQSRELVEEAGRRLGIQRIIWDS